MPRTAKLGWPTDAERPALSARQIDAVNSAFLEKHRVLWRSQLFGNRVCEAYGAIQHFIYHGRRDDYKSRLCDYADLLYLEMVRVAAVSRDKPHSQDSYFTKPLHLIIPSVRTVHITMCGDVCPWLLRMSTKQTQSRPSCASPHRSCKSKSRHGCKLFLWAKPGGGLLQVSSLPPPPCNTS